MSRNQNPDKISSSSSSNLPHFSEKEEWISAIKMIVAEVIQQQQQLKQDITS